MTQENYNVPASPEVEPAEVRKELHQTDVTHKGVPVEPAKNPDDVQSYMGAKEENVTPVRAPVTGPTHLIESDSDNNDDLEPRTEITPG